MIVFFRGDCRLILLEQTGLGIGLSDLQNGSLKQSHHDQELHPHPRDLLGPVPTRSAHLLVIPSKYYTLIILPLHQPPLLYLPPSVLHPQVNMRLRRSYSATSSPSLFNLPLSTFTTLLLAFPSLISASLDCGSIVVKDKHFDLSPLDGAHQVHWVREPEDTPGMEFNTTFTIDLCKKLKWTKGVPHEQECPHGTRSE